MTSRLIVSSNELAVPLTEAKAQLRREVDDNSMDVQITTWLRGITAAAEKFTRRAFITQTRRLTLDHFNGPIKLDFSPLVSVVSIKCLSPSRQELTLNPSSYKVDTASTPGVVVCAAGTDWPATADEVNAVTVDFTCGYGATHADVPPEVKLYILAKLVSEFGPPVAGGAATVGKPYSFIDTLLDDFRVY